MGRKTIKKIYAKLQDWYWSEHRVIRLWGKDRDTTYYVIRRRDDLVGMFSLVATHLGHIKYAVENGWIPVIDMKNYKNVYNETPGIDNSWEYYFEQPCGLGLDDIKKAKNVIFSSGNAPADFPGMGLLQNEENLKMWKSLYKKYIRFNKQTEAYVLAMKERVLGNKNGVLGVLVRGTDYTHLHPRKHPRQPGTRDAIEKVKEILGERKDLQYVYLATEDKTIYQVFKSVLGARLLFADIELRDYKDGYINRVEMERERDKEKKGREYLAQIFILAECDALVAAGCGGTYGALMMNESYKMKFIWNLGLY